LHHILGSFLKESRTLYISDFKIINSADNGNEEMYEILFRHFGLWGDIEDINLLHGKGVAFIRFLHRCMAEFAKEAMNSQPLDNNEIITIKWANDDPNPQGTEKSGNDGEMAIKNTINRKKNNENLVGFLKENNGENVKNIEEMEEFKDLGEDYAKKQEEFEKKRGIIESCQKMDEILKRIDRNNDGGFEEEEEEGKKKYIGLPEFNNQPLYFNENN